MLVRFKVTYETPDGTPRIRYTKTYSAAVIFVATMKDKKAGKNFKVSTIKLRR